MHRRTQHRAGVLSLLACLLVAAIPTSALPQQGTAPQRHRVQRPARTSGLRLDGDHHHEEVPHHLFPHGNQEDPPGADAAILAVGVPPVPVLEGGDEQAPSVVVQFGNRFLLFPPGRSPPISPLTIL
ncbi:MAG TPA: hypothetical protein VFB63_06720 [Bryobacteraceae bacterium]|nr:hypothetical protein [Bryobacteraceae bacterium]